jgi:hypothetical protein
LLILLPARERPQAVLCANASPFVSKLDAPLRSDGEGTNSTEVPASPVCSIRRGEQIA